MAKSRWKTVMFIGVVILNKDGCDMMVLQAMALFSLFGGGVGTGRSASVHVAIVNGMLGSFASGPSCHR